MKKLYLMIILFLIPFEIKAVSIKEMKIESNKEVSINETFDVNVNISFKELDPKQGMGISLVAYELLFNKDYLEIADIEDNEWQTKVYLNDNKYYLISTLGKEINENNICKDNILYCNDYKLNIKFYGKKESNEEEIKIGDVTVGMLPITTLDVSEEDVMILNLTGKSSALVKLLNSKNKELKETIVLDKSNSVTKEMIISSRSDKINSKYSVKEKDNYIEELTIDGYDLKFRKYINEYNLKVKHDVNSLKVNVKLSNKNAIYKIIGNDDLEKNNNEIKIEVKAQNEDINTYVIKIDKEEKDKVPLKNDDKKGIFGIDFDNIKIEKETLKTIGIIAGGIFILLFLIKIIIKLRDRKLEKAIKKL